MTDRRFQTAAEAYQARRRDIASMLDWLRIELDRHTQSAAAEPSTWSFSGNVNEVRRRLRETLAFISGQSEDAIESALAELRIAALLLA